MITRRLTYTAGDGRRLCALDSGGSNGSAPPVLLVPPFGVAMRDLFVPAHILCSNGFRVIRFDPRDHVGSSDGSIADWTLETLIDDIVLMARPHARLMVAGLSVSALPAIEASVRLGERVEGLVLVTPVINVRATLEAVIGTDYWDCSPDTRPSELKVLGSTVKAGFVDSCKRLGYGDTNRCHELLAEIAAPVSLIAGNRDPWVRYEEVAEVHREVALRRADVAMTVIDAASHELTRHPKLALSYLHTMVRECIRITGSARPLREAHLAELISAVHQEVIIGA
jgi:pimeloyl-ACP methyl ester carboxylesterase